MGQGAKPSSTIHNLLLKEGVIQGKKILVHKKSKKAEEKQVSPADSSPAPQAVPTQESKEEEKK